MARFKDREKALKLRREGKSYSEIKTALGISKSTLSGWLHDYPLSPVQLRELRDFNPRRIERFRATMQGKRECRLASVYQKISHEIGLLTPRELFIAGLCLYWAEGTKRSRYTVAVGNTDPAIIKTFIEWLTLLGVPRKNIVIRLQLYGDMSPKAEMHFWSTELHLPLEQFRKPYIKNNNKERITYKGGFGHGTCNAYIFGRDYHDYVLMGVKYLQDRTKGCCQDE